MNKKLTPEQKALAAKLTTLQRKYITELVKPNTTQRQAYLKAGGRAKTTSAQDQSASTMLSNSKVNEYYTSLINTSAESAIFSRDEAIRIIHDIAMDTEAAPNHRVQAVKQASDMEGWNAPKKTELTGKGGEALKIEADVTAPEIAEALENLMGKL